MEDSVLNTPEGERVKLPKFGNALRDLIGKPIDTEEIKQRLAQALPTFVPCPANVSNVSILWDTWMWKQKFIWWYKHKLGFGKKEIRLWCSIISIVSEVVGREYSCPICKDSGFSTPGTSYSDVCDTCGGQGHDADRVYEIVHQIEEETKKWWYEGSPKSIMLATINIQPTKPADYIICDFVIKKKED